MRWGRIVLAGIAVPVASLLAITIGVTGFAFRLAFAARGAPDQAEIARFAEHLGRVSWTPLSVLLTLPAAAWAARRARSLAAAHGILVGLIAAGSGMVFSAPLAWRTLAAVAATLGAGWLGAIIGTRRGHAGDSAGSRSV